MKLKGLIIAAMLFIGTIVVQAQNNGLFTKLSDDDDITTVFISKALLQMAPSSMGMGGTDIGSLMNKLNQLEIYTTEKAAKAEMMKKEADKFIKNKTYESLMTVKDGKSNVNFLVTKDRNNANNITELVMLVTDTGECTIIRISGSFTMEDIQKVMTDKQK